MESQIAEKLLETSTEIESGEGDSLVSIDLDLIPCEIQLDFPLFVRTSDDNDRRFSLVRNRGMVFSERVRSQLRRDAATLFTKEKYFRSYESSVDTHLEQILTDETVPVEKRSSILIQKGEDIMEAFFDRPDSKENYEKAQKLVGNIVRLAHASKEGVMSMLRLAKRDYQTYSHSLHVCILGVGFAQNLLSDERILRKHPFCDDVEKLGQGFIYHDLGKSLVDTDILKKAGRLSPLEWEMIKKHPLDGSQMLQEMGIRDKDIMHITLYHHERMDGTGYPYGLKENEIPVIARIAAITDAFDALTSDRPYKPAANTFEALSIMKNENGGFYDLDLFQSFVLMFHKQSADSFKQGPAAGESKPNPGEETASREK
ncbi:MAG: HD-GYP domain-containing protein [Nitrospinota bacterium]